MNSLPPYHFTRQHVGAMEYLPRHLTPAGDLSEQCYRSVCPCGWTGPAERSQTVAGGDQQDHVVQAWFASQDS